MNGMVYCLAGEIPNKRPYALIVGGVVSLEGMLYKGKYFEGYFFWFWLTFDFLEI